MLLDARVRHRPCPSLRSWASSLLQPDLFRSLAPAHVFSNVGVHCNKTYNIWCAQLRMINEQPGKKRILAGRSASNPRMTVRKRTLLARREAEECLLELQAKHGVQHKVEQVKGLSLMPHHPPTIHTTTCNIMCCCSP
jgi:hypothetical protein